MLEEIGELVASQNEGGPSAISDDEGEEDDGDEQRDIDVSNVMGTADVDTRSQSRSDVRVSRPDADQPCSNAGAERDTEPELPE